MSIMKLNSAQKMIKRQERLIKLYDLLVQKKNYDLMSTYYKQGEDKRKITKQNEVYKALCSNKLKNTRLHFAWIIYTKPTQTINSSSRDMT